MKIQAASFLSVLLFTLTAGLVSADVVVTKNGARLIGTVDKIDGIFLVLDTDFAGELKIKQAEVVSVSIEKPIVIRLAGGTVMEGTVVTQPDGKLAISGHDGTITTTVDKVAATWAPGGKDPALAALEPHWQYEVTADVTGKSGNSEQLGTAGAARATRKGLTDKLQFYSAYNRQETDGETSADQFKAGVDYANNFSGRKSWYMRDEGGFDRVKEISLYNVAGTGLGYDMIKKPYQLLTGRAGLSFRYEAYDDPATDDLKSLGLDFGLNHEYTFANSKLVNSFTFVPAFEDFGNYRATHESYYEIPMAHPAWKLRLGLSHDYNSQPGTGIDKLDTTYFSRFVLNWK